MKLSFLTPDDDLHLNLGIIILIVRFLSQTKRGVLKLNNERLHIYHFLARNSVKLNQVMGILGKENVFLSHQELYSVASISANVDPLFDRKSLKSLLTILVSQKIVEVEYKKNDGFLYKLSSKGKELAESFIDEFYTEIKINCQRLQSTLSMSQSNLNNALGQIMRMDAF